MKSFKELKLTLKYHNKLNPKFWEGKKIKTKVRNSLLKIAKEWAKFSDIPSNSIIDIILVGGNANYNYTKYSDLDLHLLVDKHKIANCPDLIDEYLRDKKQLWALTHDIKIYGHSVELYAQDRNEKTSSNQGVFSLKKNQWIRFPEFTEVNLKDPSIVDKVKYYIEKINFLISNKSNDYDTFVKLKEKIRDMRTSGIQRGGEFGIENLVYKELRNLGYIDKLINHIKHIKTTNLSLT